MKQKEVKTEQALRKLAKELMDDLTSELSYSKGIIIDQEKRVDEIYLHITDKDKLSQIISGSVMTDIVDVIAYYNRHYRFSISYYIDVVEWINEHGTKEYIPAVVIRLHKYIKEA